MYFYKRNNAYSNALKIFSIHFGYKKGFFNPLFYSLMLFFSPIVDNIVDKWDNIMHF